MALKGTILFTVVILLFSSGYAENLYIIPDKAENLANIQNLDGVDIYAIMQTGILIGIAQPEKDSFNVRHFNSVHLGERAEAEEYYLFQIDDPDIERLADHINVIFYENGEAIARTSEAIDDHSLAWMKRLTHISFTGKPKPKKKADFMSPGIITDAWIDDIVSQVSQAEYAVNVQRLQDFVTRYSPTDSCRAAENWAIYQFGQLGLETQLFAYTYSGQTWYDAIGRHVGTVYPDSIYLMIAHIDATSENAQNSAPGAEDNASGSACVLEAARVLSQYDFNCTIEFVLVSGEEQGLYGSEAYAHYCFDNQRNIAGVLNFDMIAYAGTYGWDINIFSDQTFADEVALADLLAFYIDEYSLTAYPIRVNTIGPEYGSDHYYFSYYGFPAPFAIDAQLWSAPDWYPWYHSTGDVITNLDLDYATEVVRGAVATVAALAGARLEPQLHFSYPDGLPDLINPPGGTSLAVQITPGTANPQPATAALYYRVTDNYISVPMSFVNPDLYYAIFPSIDCGLEISFYIAVETDSGSIVTDPPGAPGRVYSALSAADLITVFTDNFNTDLGWTVQNSCTDGQWQRGVPAGGGDRGDPPTDHDSSGYCYVTDNEYGNSDVDDGYTWLISPPIDLDTNIAIAGYALWYTNNFGDSPNSDYFVTYVSNNNGGSWVVVDSVGPHTSPGWGERSFRIDDYVAPGGPIRIRFEASDLGSGSVVEAGIDAVIVRIIDCEASSTGAIAGIVTGGEGPIAGVYASLPGDIVFDTTDGEGNFTLTGLAAGIYAVEFEHPAYYDTTITGVVVAADSTTILDVFLISQIVDYSYLPGDANMSVGQWPPLVIGGDVTYLVNYFRGISQACLLAGFYCSGDANGDCQVIGSDVTRMVTYFRGLADITPCPDYPPAWPTPVDLPIDPPPGWPNCQTFNLKITP